MPFGYQGRILDVDLSTGKIVVQTPPPEFYRWLMGGSALGAYVLFHETKPGIDPLGPENILILATSIVTGAPISGFSRLSTTAKSPLTGAIGDSQSGGFFPVELKFAGFDAIIVRGRAARPVYLWVHDGQAEIRPAEHLWGKITGEVERSILEELGDSRVRVLQCGPAGEKAVRFAALLSGCTRANGRTGMGAVMGSKLLKAIAVWGRDRPTLADPAGLAALAKWGAAQLEDSSVHNLAVLGTGGIVKSQNEAGGLVSHNWQSGHFDGYKALDGRTLVKTIQKKRDSCYACVVRCKRVVEIESDLNPVDPFYGGPEYETIAAFGSYCGIDDLAAVARANQLCNMFGMDTISCGATIAWAMDCYERGLITRADTGGLDLRFGNAEAMLALTEAIGKRQGFGDLLAEGSWRAAQAIGRGSDQLVVAVKGQELPAHMPQVKRSLGLIYAVNPFGADHQSSEHDPCYEDYPERLSELGLVDPQPARILNHEKVRFALITQYAYSCLDSLNVCQFVFGPAWQLYSMVQLGQVVRQVTGWQIDVSDLLKLGELRLNLLRAYNAREGFDRAADLLPVKLMQPLVGGKSDGLALTESEIEEAKSTYYRLAGWDEISGNPTPEKLAHLGLSLDG